MILNGVDVTVRDFQGMSDYEIIGYIDYIQKNTDEELSALTISSAKDGQVVLDYTLQPAKFERIRRITGYLVGTTDRWNNAKRSEEHDRVKHVLN